jgi:hypothetical protein
MTIDNILRISFSTVKDDQLRGGKTFINPILQHLFDSGKIVKAPLGPNVEVDGKLYGVQEISIPMTWTVEASLWNEADKIHIVATVLRGAFMETDRIFLQSLR